MRGRRPWLRRLVVGATIVAAALVNATLLMSSWTASASPGRVHHDEAAAPSAGAPATTSGPSTAARTGTSGATCPPSPLTSAICPPLAGPPPGRSISEAARADHGPGAGPPPQRTPDVHWPVLMGIAGVGLLGLAAVRRRPVP